MGASATGRRYDRYGERMPKSKYESRKIVYYAVVNAILEPIYIDYIEHFASTSDRGEVFKIHGEFLQPLCLPSTLPVLDCVDIALAVSHCLAGQAAP